MYSSFAMRNYDGAFLFRLTDRLTDTVDRFLIIKKNRLSAPLQIAVKVYDNLYFENYSILTLTLFYPEEVN